MGVNLGTAIASSSFPRDGLPMDMWAFCTSTTSTLSEMDMILSSGMYATVPLRLTAKKLGDDRIRSCSKPGLKSLVNLQRLGRRVPSVGKVKDEVI